MNDPLALLPPGITFDYLRKLVNLDPIWNIQVLYDTAMDIQYAAQVDWDHATHSAMVCINANYHFSDRALARAITHELLELATVDTWIIFKQLSSASGRNEVVEQQYRTARDKQIDQRLGAMPFWGNYDVPVAR